MAAFILSEGQRPASSLLLLFSMMCHVSKPLSWCCRYFKIINAIPLILVEKAENPLIPGSTRMDNNNNKCKTEQSFWNLKKSIADVQLNFRG